jgi:hypothetical protein
MTISTSPDPTTTYGDQRWAQLRQVVLATANHDADVVAAQKLLGLGPSFADPVLAEWGLADATMPVGPDTYLEFVSPTSSDHPLSRWLQRVGGGGGYVLSTQVPSIEGVRERCAQLGVGIVADTETDGHSILQLHPKQMGVMLELDEFLPRGEWFWDELPDAVAAHTFVGADIVDIRAVEISTPDPVALAERWTDILGLAPAVEEGEAIVVSFDGRPIRFVTGEVTRMTAVDVVAADRENGVGRRATVCQVEFRFI